MGPRASRWPLLATAIALGVVALDVQSIGGALGALLAIRWTARGSLVLLTAAMIAPSFAKQARPYIEALALSHTAHGVGIALLAYHTHGENIAQRGLFDVAAGAGAYAIVVALVVWRRPMLLVVDVGLFYVWGIFGVSYLDRFLAAPNAYGPAIVLVLGGALVCAARWVSAASRAVSAGSTSGRVSANRTRPPIGM